MGTHLVLIDGKWQPSIGTKTFTAVNPATKQAIPGAYPVSPWDEVVAALQAADRAARVVRGWSGDRFANFLRAYATRIEARAAELVATALERGDTELRRRDRAPQLVRGVRKRKCLGHSTRSVNL